MKSWKTPTPEQVARAIALLGHLEHRRYFFDRLENPNWIALLRDRGFLSTPPPVVRDDATGSIHFPPWPESQYLARMVVHVPEAVLNIIVEIDTENVLVHEDFADAALAMPAELAAKWVKKETRW